MLKKTTMAALAIVGLVFAGCGGDGTDGGAGSGGSGGSGGTGGTGGQGGAVGYDLAGAHLMSGTYNVSSIVKVKDECKLTLEDGTFTTQQVINDGTTIAIGGHYDTTTDPSFNPPGYAFGSAGYTTATTATLMTMVVEGFADDGCQITLTRTANIQLIGNNAITVDYTDTESNQNSKCSAANQESTTTCTSHYTYTLSK